MSELVRGLDGFAQREVAWQDDVFPLQRDEQGTLHGPRADTGNSGELGDQLLVGQANQLDKVKPTVRQPLREVPERADLPPRQPGLAQLARVYGQQFGGCGKMPAEQVQDAGQRSAGRRDGQLLAGDLEQQGTEQVHRWQLGHPRPGIEVRPVVDQPR